MNTPFRYMIAFGFAFGAIIRVHSQGYIVPNGVTYSSNSGSLNAVIHVLQNPTNSDYTGFILRPRFTTPPNVYYTIFSFDPFRDEGIRTFLASPNDPISLQTIQANSYTELTSGNLYGFDLDVPFYLGFYTGYTNGTPAGVYSNPVFGWGEFVNNQGVIQMLDAALVMEAGGIYVGTQTIIPVPEPGVLSFYAIGALMFGWRFTRLNQSAPANPAIASRLQSSVLVGRVAEFTSEVIRQRGFSFFFTGFLKGLLPSSTWSNSATSGLLVLRRAAS
jgi:hypothetical protein